MRWIYRLASIAVLLAIIMVSIIALIPAERIADFAAREISARTGRTVRISGKIKPVFYPVLGIRTGGISVSNANWASHDKMVSADGLLVGVELGPLIRGEVRIKELRLTRPEIWLEQASDGRNNWDLANAAGQGTTATDSGAPSLQEFSLADGRISDGKLVFIDHAAKTEIAFESVDLALSFPGMARKARFSGDLTTNGETVSFAADIARPGALLAGGVSALSAQLTGDFGVLKADGRAGLGPMAAEIKLDVAISDVSRALKLIGQATEIGPSLAKKIDVGGVVTYAGGDQVFLRQGVFQVDENEVMGNLDLTLSDRVFLTASLAAKDVNLAVLLGGSTEDSAVDRQTSEEGWSKDRIDLSALSAIDADIAFVANSIDLGTAKVGATRLRARLDKGRMAVKVTDIQAYGGKITGDYVVNARDGLSMSADLSLAGVQMQPLLIDLADFDRLITSADARVSFLTAGSSLHTMMRRLSGSGRVNVGAGELLGLDLVGMLRNLDASYRGKNNKTIFSSISGSYEIAGGVLKNSDLEFANPLIDATGEGQVDIGAQTVAYRITPARLSQSDTAKGIGVPVLISGPWSNLHYKADLKGLFDAELDAQKAKAAERLRRDAEQARKEAEDKLRDQVDNALKKGADKILGDVLKRKKKK